MTLKVMAVYYQSLNKQGFLPPGLFNAQIIIYPTLAANLKWDYSSNASGPCHQGG
jgi:hypothetical protein